MPQRPCGPVGKVGTPEGQTLASTSEAVTGSDLTMVTSPESQ
jgi:hypothetical protein